MHILQQAVANFDARPRKSVEVPEWSSDPKKPVVVYFKTPNAKMLAKAQGEAKGSMVEEAARLVAMCCTDENDKRLFTDADYTELMIRTDPRGIARVAGAILADARLDVVQAEKN